MISLIFVTNRKEPLVNWFIDSLRLQYKKDFPLQVIFVDYWKNSRGNEFKTDFCESIHVSPLPSPVQGEHKLTKEDWFSATIARNTGIVYAIHPYIQFVDDLAVLMPNWLHGVGIAAQQGVVLQSSYRKDNNMVVENGLLVSSTIGSQDSRVKHARNNAGRPEWCYGNLGLPLELALKVNGYDELCSITGYEDCQFGMRLAKVGAKFFYNANVLAVESEEMHFKEGQYFKRQDPETTQERYTEVLKSFGVDYHAPHNGRHDASHIIVELPKHKGHKAYWNGYDLRELRRKRESGQQITIEDMKFYEKFWFTGEPLTALSS